jgi:cytoplasmic tRNA 2-thiolation protein 1
LDYFSTECIYSPDAYRGHARAFLKDLEAARPSAIIDIIHSGEAFEIKEEIKATQKVQRKPILKSFEVEVKEIQNLELYLETCQRCGYMSSNALCKACTLLEGLERGMANAGIVSRLFVSLNITTYNIFNLYRRTEHERN